MEGYDVAQICINGHVISSMASNPNYRKEFCNICGAVTIMVCQKCKAPIKGYYHSPGVISLIDFNPPRFCERCGEPFPWIKSRLDASKELIDLIEHFSDEEKDDLKNSIEDIIRDSPKISVARIKLRKYLSKIDISIADGINNLIDSSQKIEEE
jgi:hypothetical protein